MSISNNINPVKISGRKRKSIVINQSWRKEIGMYTIILTRTDNCRGVTITSITDNVMKFFQPPRASAVNQTVLNTGSGPTQVMM